MLNKSKYVPDLSRLQANCEANYLRIMKLMPIDLEDVSHREFDVSTDKLDFGAVRLEVIERFKYTMTVLISQKTSVSTWLNSSQMTVRLYHDAKMAEVITMKRPMQYKSVYNYPNADMYHVDEKAQLNEFLAEWLSLCLEHGHAKIVEI